MTPLPPKSQLQNFIKYKSFTYKYGELYKINIRRRSNYSKILSIVVCDDQEKIVFMFLNYHH